MIINENEKNSHFQVTLGYTVQVQVWIRALKEMDAACVLFFTQEERDSENEEENEASETILREGMQVYTR